MTTNHPVVPNPPVIGARAAGAGCKPALLDTQETSDTSSRPPSYRDFLISGIKPTIDFHHRVYKAIDDRDDSKRAAVFTECKSRAWFVRNIHTSEVRVAASRCHLRWCPLCIRTKTYIIQQSVGGWLRNHPDSKFITLTLKHSADDLNTQVDRLYDGFRKLRRRKWFERIVKGGIWFFQIKKGKSDDLWHPHIHCLVDGAFVPQKKLSAEWLEITGDSYICDVRPIKDPQKAADYVARYAAAPCRLSEFSLADAVDCVDALHSRRICGTWGTGAEIKLAAQKPEDVDDWQHVAGWSWVVLNRRSNPEAQSIMTAFLTSQPLEIPPPPPPDIIADAEKFFVETIPAERNFWHQWYLTSPARGVDAVAFDRKNKPEKPFTWRQVAAETNMLFV
jgi:hypothetical protein